MLKLSIASTLSIAIAGSSPVHAASTSPFDFNITANTSTSPILEIKDRGRRVVAIELNGSVSIANGHTVDDAAEKTYEEAPFNGECMKDYTYTYEFTIGSWSVGLKPNGDVVYVGITPTPVADSYYHKLASIAGRASCNS